MQSAQVLAPWMVFAGHSGVSSSGLVARMARIAARVSGVTLA